MKNVVMGTAGHIDHGKTSLVKRLTGVDTDRLEEEKRRGMTIELGFAPLTLPSGNTISIIDVPGHEKFVKTMVAGVTGIDFVMLVIAADEGVMPQTREHMDILSLLNINTGVVALTKTDLVDAEWIGMVTEDINKELSGTTLEGFPTIPVSSATGYGLDKLVECLEILAEQAAGKNAQDLFRLPIDRVFTISGHGTVITGTVSGGKITKGDMVEILPSGHKARTRSIQVHNKRVESAGAGDRCALNLAGIEKEDIERGNVAVSQGIISPTRIVDAVLHTVKGNGSIKHNQRVHAHIGTQEAVARVRIIGTDEIPDGEKGYVQLRFEGPVVALRGDRFIVRSYSPVTTLGGGRILFHAPPNRPRFLKESLDALIIGEEGSPQEIVSLILEVSGKIISLDELWKELLINKDELQRILTDEVESGRALYLKEVDKYLSREIFKLYIKKLNIEFEEFYRKYPYRYQIDKEEVKSKVFSGLDLKDYAALLNRLVEDGQFILENNNIMQPGKSVINRIFAMNEIGVLERELLKDGLNTRNAQQLGKDVNIELNKISEIEKFLQQTGRITDLGGGMFVHNNALKHSVNKIKAVLEEKGSATAAEIRDCLGIGRKTAIALAEYLDSIGVTERVGDARKLRESEVKIK